MRDFNKRHLYWMVPVGGLFLKWFIGGIYQSDRTSEAYQQALQTFAGSDGIVQSEERDAFHQIIIDRYNYTIHETGGGAYMSPTGGGGLTPIQTSASDDSTKYRLPKFREDNWEVGHDTLEDIFKKIIKEREGN